MPRPTPTAVRSWADEIGTANQLLAELDFRLVYMLAAIAEDTELADRLYLKGGTAINKLYLKDLLRLSVDLDFNHVGPKDQVIRERNKVINRVVETVRSHDQSYDLEVSKRRYEQTTIRAIYSSLAGRAPQHIKIEISHIERFPILPTARRPLHLPRGGKVWLTTYRPEELIATKIRALYDRLKGRDVYDLWSVSRALELDKTAVRKLFLYYFYRDRKIFHPKLFFGHMREAVSESAIDDDGSGFIRPDVKFDLHDAAKAVVTWLDFLRNLDASDEDFLLLVRVLLRKGEIPKGKKRHIESITYPLRFLFGEAHEITEQASQITRSDIAPFTKK